MFINNAALRMEIPNNLRYRNGRVHINYDPIMYPSQNKAHHEHVRP